MTANRQDSGASRNMNRGIGRNGGDHSAQQDRTNAQQPESGNTANGDPANNVILPHGEQRGDAGNGGDTRAQQVPASGGDSGDAAAQGHEAGTRGSGNEPQSGAGRLADDRPGRNAPKGS